MEEHTKMHDYTQFDVYYNELVNDIYDQPDTEQHLEWADEVIYKWVLPLGITSVLDVGCGEAFAQDMFKYYKIKDYTGVCLGDDYEKATKMGRNVYPFDFNFLPIGNDFFDLVFARHSLEHSPFPLLTLMEWHRVAKRYLILVLPNPDHFTFIGRNHYSVMENKTQVRWILRRSGWKLMKREYTDYEYRYLCEKRPRISYEGWARTPLDASVYESDRDDLEEWKR